jgi:hypothetical protein
MMALPFLSNPPFLSSDLEAAGKRPLGVAVLAWLSLVGGILGLLAGLLVAIVFGAVLPALPPLEPLDDSLTDEEQQELDMVMSPEFVAFMFRISIFIAVSSALFGMMGIGLLKRTRWSWKFAVGLIIGTLAMNILFYFVDLLGVLPLVGERYAPFSAENAASTIVSISVNLAISLLILYYLFRPHVRRYLAQ